MDLLEYAPVVKSISDVVVLIAVIYLYKRVNKLEGLRGIKDLLKEKKLIKKAKAQKK